MKPAGLDRVRLLDLEPTTDDFEAQLLAGLRRQPRRLPCKFFYDSVGSALFELICETPEYYPTRTELKILAEHAAAIADFAGPGARVVELGSGSSRKTRLLLDALREPAAYVPIDISREHLLNAANAVADEYPALPVMAICADYARPLSLPEEDGTRGRTILFFPGSTIGNLEAPEAVGLLARVGQWCRSGDRLIIGVDLEKPLEVVVPAYNDKAGVTAAFNLNLLARANRELGATFDLDRFSHEAIYDRAHQRIEMRLISQQQQAAEVGGAWFAFAAEAVITTEFSHKYTPSRFQQLAEAAGWSFTSYWTDDRGWFGVFGLTWSGR
jgi:dimethylhistidine N-methyltransferase